MSFLFEVIDKRVVPNSETLLIFPFKDIWERDTLPGKELAHQEFAYIEFMSSQKKSNPYKDYGDAIRYISDGEITTEMPSIKHEKVLEGIKLASDYKPDALVHKGIDHWIEFQKEASPTYSYYIAAKIAAEKMKNFFTEVDLNERNFKSGTPIYKPKDITGALNDTEKVIANLDSLKKKVEEELYETTKNRSQKRISPFANTNSLK